MSDTGFVTASAGTAITSFGVIPWQQPEDITSSGGLTISDIVTTASSVTNYLGAKGFGLSIPAGASVRGIEVRTQVADTGGNPQGWHRVRLLKAGAVQSGDRANGRTIDPTSAFYTFGSSSDLWDDTWTAGDINDSGFGCVMSIGITDPDNQQMLVNVVYMQVTYVLAVTSSAGAILQAQQALTANVGASLQANQTQTASVQASLVSHFTKTSTVGAVVQLQETLAASVGASLQGGMTQAASLRASLQKKFSLTARAGAHIRDYWAPRSDVTTIWSEV